MTQQRLIAIASVAIIALVGYFFVGEIGGLFTSRKSSMEAKCDQVAEMINAPSARDRLKGMTADQLRAEKRRVEECREYWFNGTISLD